MTRPLEARCHCGAVVIPIARAPSEVTHCNCSLCRSYGVVWAYYDVADLAIPAEAATHSYAWNGRHVDFHRCTECGCVTHWIPRDATRTRRGINANLIPLERLTGVRVRHRDGAGSGRYID